MKATIVNFRTARHHQTQNQLVLKVADVKDKDSAAKMIGRKVSYRCTGKAGKTISGEITAAHGNSGALRARFEKGIPGQALGTQIDIE